MPLPVRNLPTVVVLIAWLANTAEASSRPGATAQGADNPGIGRFGPAITFYLGFEHGLLAEMAKGRAQPTRIIGTPRFQPGLYGRAMTIAAPDKTAHVWYSTLGGNVDLTRPGSLSLWVSPRGWVRSENEDYFFPAKIMSNYCILQFGRQGRLESGRVDMIYLWARLGLTKARLVGGGNSLAWKNDEWHLWVMNWRSRSVEFSIDGRPFNRADTPVPFNTEWDGTGHTHLFVGAQDPTAAYLVDEVLVLHRPLTQSEVRWLYGQGIRQARSNLQRESKR